MARAIYILCSENGAIDRDTGKISHFNVIDSLDVTITKQEFPKRSKASRQELHVGGPLEIHICAAWARDENDDPATEYEMELGFTRPGEDKESLLKGDTFRFEKTSHRAIVRLTIAARPDMKSGHFRFEARIRKRGTKTWLRQEGLIPVTVHVLETVAPSGKRVSPKAR
jgi:hypothetical protein